ncbi:MAG: DUF3375 domain-containing protein, partial [Bacteroidia bacterium]|nr:DUF3375 domain-containing protein [Bacteroidia bacterium]
MDFLDLHSLIQNSISIKLIRAQNAPLIISFLHREFKENNRFVIPHTELLPKLSDFLEYVSSKEDAAMVEDAAEDSNQDRAKRYLDQWTEQSFIRKYPDDNGEHVYELTTDAEKTFSWVESLYKRDFIGTESKFKDIFHKLQNLLENSTEDPQVKIRDLERQKVLLENEIRQIKISQHVPVYNDTQIKERFFEINKLSKDLLSDFREVEQNFKEIIRNIYEKQSDRNYTKGGILGYALDALDELKQKDQGKSFYAFWHFLVNNQSQEELRVLIDDVYVLLNKRHIPYEDDRFLKRLKVMLYQAGKKVIDSNKQLSAKLNKVLSERNMLEGRRTMELIADIRNTALRIYKAPPKETAFMLIDGDTDISNVMARPLTEYPHEEMEKAIPTEGPAFDLTGIQFEN